MFPNAFLGWSAAESSGQEVVVNTLSGNGGITIGTQFTFTTEFQGKWVVSTFSGEAEAGFFLLTVLDTESLSAKGCEEGSVAFRNGLISNLIVRPSRQQIIGNGVE